MYYVGIAAFLLFLIGDFNDLTYHRKALKPCFGIGILLLLTSTAGLAVQNAAANPFHFAVRIVFGLLGGFFLVMLIFTLFFALPFQSTYVKVEGKNPVCDRGVYALCRHPGVIWFFFLYGCLWVSVGIPIYAAATFSLLNLLYALMQDRYIFPKLLAGYASYKERTPFLIPNAQSIRRCLAYYKKTEVR